MQEIQKLIKLLQNSLICINSANHNFYENPCKP